ncbi:MAG: hypothetical protein CSB24_04510 [Deltaproteobacteria bacterium]|nr:MAG: hypothetical protein CSB24_04510 [Deltaproteobacteria bacterium]
MQFFSFLTIAVFMVVLQTTIFLGRLDLVYILTAFLAYRAKWVTGGLLIALTGWTLDVVAGIFMGACTIEYLLVFAFLKLLTENSPVKRSVYQIPLTGISYLLVQVIKSVSYSFSIEEPEVVLAWRSIFEESILITVVAIPCLWFFNHIYERINSYTFKTRKFV